MSKSATISMRVDPELKTNTDEILGRLGMTMSQAITLFLRQIEFHHGLPFEVKIPNRETQKAIKNAIQKRESDTFDNLDDLFDDLGI